MVAQSTTTKTIYRSILFFLGAAQKVTHSKLSEVTVTFDPLPGNAFFKVGDAITCP